MTDPLETRYARSGDLRIAYQVVGDGQPLVVSDQWFGHVDMHRGGPAWSGFEFEDRGAHVLKGVPGLWSLYRAVPAP